MTGGREIRTGCRAANPSGDRKGGVRGTQGPNSSAQDPSATLGETLERAGQRLLAARLPDGYWQGELSSSALSTATAVCALALLDGASGADRFAGLVRGGLAWLADNQNDDGGWGDTPDSPSNISTATLCWAALGAGQRVGQECHTVAQRVETWLKREVGDLTPPNVARAISAVYGRDRTFAVPILTMCALSGRFGSGRWAWDSIRALPFELAACPHAWFRWLRLSVVSYALPALIAIGQAIHHHRPGRNPVARCLRSLACGRTLRLLKSIQPESGGFLEAAPLTSFVVMSLASTGRWDHPVVERGCAFLAATVRDDGSWPIDTDLATWLTTLSVNALAGGGNVRTHMSTGQRAVLRRWLLDQQYQREHPYTRAAPGGWAWTDRSGGVPDADDTAGALLALWHLADRDESNRMPTEEIDAATAGVRWLLNLQNSDGGIPTFCRGWGKMPFDRSSPDLTAHALRAWHRWREALAGDLRDRIQRASRRAVRFLLRAQRADGAWVPLWFGNQHALSRENPLYGTTRVLRIGDVVSPDGTLGDAWSQARRRGVDWVLSAQNPDGGWGGAVSVPSSIEETALAVEALAGIMEGEDETIVGSIERGSAWLIEHTGGGLHFDPVPIGLYFAKLWYFERLYPLIFTVAALERVSRLHADEHESVRGRARSSTRSPQKRRAPDL
jgi:squalene-hopene/tetraprenyl-beta-curcumene cyclase